MKIHKKSAPKEEEEGEDETLECRDCGAEFVFSVGEQQFFKEKGFDNKPSRCADCKAAKKARFDGEGGGGGGGRGGRGGRGGGPVRIVESIHSHFETAASQSCSRSPCPHPFHFARHNLASLADSVPLSSCARRPRRRRPRTRPRRRR